MYATIHGHLNVVAVLLAHGALVYTTNRVRHLASATHLVVFSQVLSHAQNGKTAFDWAKSTEVKDLLRKAMVRTAFPPHPHHAL